MRKDMLTMAALALTATAWAGGENTPRLAWTLTPEAEAAMKEIRTCARAWKPLSERVAFFPRAQLKYDLFRDDLIHSFWERPLSQDSRWAPTARSGKLLHPEAWKQTAADLKLGGMDGLAVCISQTRRDEAVAMSLTPGGETPILVELPYDYNDKGFDSYVKTAGTALAMPNSFRLDGKVVLTRYPEVGGDKLDFCEQVRAKLAERFGPDKFLVMFYVNPFPEKLPNRPLSLEDLERAREHLRRCLRKMDGLCLSSFMSGNPRRASGEFERSVVVPLCQSVMSEPEFAGKKRLAAVIRPGHENTYRWNYSIDSEGTRHLAERLKTVLALRPDFVIGAEWDELNENTSFQPTVSNGFVHQRLVRWFVDASAGRAPTPFPGDDVTVPNLVVSYRKSLVAGEPLEVEVRNIPDGTFGGETLTVQLRWKGLDGNVVKTYPPQALRADEMEAVRFVSPASELAANHRIVLPELAVAASSGARFRFGDGFWPLDLNALRTVDSKWVKQAVRERPKGVMGALTLGAPGADGLREVAGRFSSPLPLKSVEVLENSDTVYMFEPGAKTSDDRVTVRLALQARCDRNRVALMSGTIRYENAPGVEILTSVPRNGQKLADGWRFEGHPFGNVCVKLFASVPTSEVDRAEIAVDLGPLVTARLKVREIVEKEVVGVGIPLGGNLVASRFTSQIAIPPPIGVTAGEFRFRHKPCEPTAVYRLQVVDAAGRVWRGAPQTAFEPAGETVSYRIYERDEDQTRVFSVDRNRVTEPSYDFGNARGTVVWSDLGRAFSGVRNGAASLVTGFGEGERNYGDSVSRYLKDGAGAYAMLPPQLVSRFAGFEISFEVKPDDLAGVQGLVDSGNAAYTIRMVDGVPECALFDSLNYIRMTSRTPRAKGPKLAAGKWNRVIVTYDEETLVVSVDGVRGEPVKASVYQLQARYTSVGALNHGPNCLRGAIRNLRFAVPRLDDLNAIGCRPLAFNMSR